MQSVEHAVEGYDVDHDPSQQRFKRGGYTWAGGWIDPKVPAGGPKEHPTMSLADSIRKNQEFVNSAKKWKLQRNLDYAMAGSGF